jgi:hypothetical protein
MWGGLFDCEQVQAGVGHALGGVGHALGACRNEKSRKIDCNLNYLDY